MNKFADYFKVDCACMKRFDNKGFTAIDFFCGGGGMTCGLRQAYWDLDEDYGTLRRNLERNSLMHDNLYNIILVLSTMS